MLHTRGVRRAHHVVGDAVRQVYINVTRDKHFQNRIKELLDMARRLAEKEKDGYHYKKIRRKAHKVKAYNVRAHWAMIPVKRK